jgi:protein SCO1/2
VSDRTTPSESHGHAGKARLLVLVLGAALLGVLAARAMLVLRPTEDLPVLGHVPRFTLTDQTGADFSDADLAGIPWIATFVYSTCPGPCPRVIEKIQAADRRLSHDPRIRLVSVTVDPAADTPEVLAVYGRNRSIDPRRWKLLTGDPDTVFALVRGGFKLGVERDDNAPPDVGPVIHSLMAVLVDGERQVRGYYDTNDADAMDRLVDDARALADAGEPK